MKNVFVLFVLMAMISCDIKENDLDPLVETYPMTVGSEWTYDRKLIVKKYESETSDQIINTDTLHSVVRVWIEKDTLLKDAQQVKVFKCIIDDYIYPVTSKSYKFIDHEGLKTYAYLNAGVNVFSQKEKGYLKSAFIFNPMSGHSLATDDEIIFESQPTLDIKFPLVNNSSWTYRQNVYQTNLPIEKKVIGPENVYLSGQNFPCYMVDWVFPDSRQGIKMTDWISDKGLIKRITINDRASMLHEDGTQTGDLFQITETLILKAIDLK